MHTHRWRALQTRINDTAAPILQDDTAWIWNPIARAHLPISTISITCTITRSPFLGKVILDFHCCLLSTDEATRTQTLPCTISRRWNPYLPPPSLLPLQTCFPKDSSFIPSNEEFILELARRLGNPPRCTESRGCKRGISFHIRYPLCRSGYHSGTRSRRIYTFSDDVLGESIDGIWLEVGSDGFWFDDDADRQLIALLKASFETGSDCLVDWLKIWTEWRYGLLWWETWCRCWWDLVMHLYKK